MRISPLSSVVTMTTSDRGRGELSINSTQARVGVRSMQSRKRVGVRIPAITKAGALHITSCRPSKLSFIHKMSNDLSNDFSVRPWNLYSHPTFAATPCHRSHEDVCVSCADIVFHKIVIFQRLNACV